MEDRRVTNLPKPGRPTGPPTPSANAERAHRHLINLEFGKSGRIPENRSPIGTNAFSSFLISVAACSPLACPSRKACIAAGGVTREDRWLQNRLARLLDWPRERVKLGLAQLAAIERKELSREAVERVPNLEAAVVLHREVQKAKKNGRPLARAKQLQIAESVAKFSEGSAARAVRYKIQDALHPVDPDLAGKKDQFEELLFEGASKARTLDVIIQKIKKQKSKLHSEKYKGSLAAMALAANCQGVTDQILDLFSKEGQTTAESGGTGDRSLMS